MGAGTFDFLESALGIAGLHVHAPHRVFDDGDVETEAESVENALLHAVVGRKPGDEETVNAPLPQELVEPRVLEGRIALAVGILALVDHNVDPGSLEGGRQLGAGSPLRAMDGPNRRWVRSSPDGGVDLDAFEGAMVGGVPVASGDD